VMNDQRKVVYEQRNDIMDAEGVEDIVLDMRRETINAIVGEACPPNTYPEQWDIEALKVKCFDTLGVELPIEQWLTEDEVDPEMLEVRITEAADALIAEKAAELPA